MPGVPKWKEKSLGEASLSLCFESSSNFCEGRQNLPNARRNKEKIAAVCGGFRYSALKARCFVLRKPSVLSECFSRRALPMHAQFDFFFVSFPYAGIRRSARSPPMSAICGKYNLSIESPSFIICI